MIYTTIQPLLTSSTITPIGRCIATCIYTAPQLYHTATQCQPRQRPTHKYTPSRRIHTTRTTHAPARDPYNVLGVGKSATADEIKKQYFKLAKQFHPDLKPGDKTAADKFAELGNAYETLSDPEKRRAFDTYGTADPQEQAAYQQAQSGWGGFGGPSAGGGGGGGGFGGFGGGAGGGGFEDIFGNMFRQQTNMRSPTRGSDLTTTANISFNEAVSGTTREVRLTRNTVCSSCSGSGHKAGSSQSSTCTGCGGTGQQISQRGIFSMQQTCSQCNGTGRSAPQCNVCNGSGLVRETKTITVNIPAGVSEDTTLRIPNQGDAGQLGGPRGHLFVKLNISGDNRFKRDGSDIYVDANIPVTTAMLGGYVNVPTLTGEARVKVDAGIQHGDKRRLRGKGLPVLNSSNKGDQYVVFNVKIPTSLSSAQKTAAEQLHTALGERSMHTDAHHNGGSSAGGAGSNESGKSEDGADGDANSGVFGRWFSNNGKKNKPDT